MISGKKLKKILKETSKYFKTDAGGYKSIAIESRRNKIYLHISTPLFHISVLVGKHRGSVNRGYYYVYSNSPGHGDAYMSKSNKVDLGKVSSDDIPIDITDEIMTIGDQTIRVCLKDDFSPISGTWAGIGCKGDFSKVKRFSDMFNDEDYMPDFWRVIAFDPEGWAACAHGHHMLRIDEYSSSERIYMAIAASKLIGELGTLRGVGKSENSTLWSFTEGEIVTTFKDRYPNPYEVMPDILKGDQLDWVKCAEIDVNRATASAVGKMSGDHVIFKNDGKFFSASDTKGNGITFNSSTGIKMDEAFSISDVKKFFKMCYRNKHGATLYMKIRREEPGVGDGRSISYFSHRGISWICMPLKKAD